MQEIEALERGAERAEHAGMHQTAANYRVRACRLRMELVRGEAKRAVRWANVAIACSAVSVVVNGVWLLVEVAG